MAVVITVQEAAQMLKLHPRTIMNMARRGEIPATKIGRQWRFDTGVLEKWLTDQMASGGRAHETEAAHAAEARPLADLINGSIRCVDRVASKEEVLEALADLARAKFPALSSERLRDALHKREELFPTAIAGGIAFPHPRRPLENLHEPILALLNVRTGVAFGAPDGEPTFTFVLVCSPDDAAHLRLLARLTTVLRKNSTVRSVNKCQSPHEVIALLRRLEENVAKHKGNSREESQ